MSESIEIHYQHIISAFAHELRNLLTLTNSSLQLIEKCHPEVTDFSHWPEVQSDFHHALSLLQQLSDYNNSTKLYQKPVDLQKLTESIIQTCSPWVESRHQKLCFHCAAMTQPPVLFLDVTKIQEAIINLIKNASEASTDGNCIEVTLTAQDDTILLCVRDHGCGIPPERLAQIFEPFCTFKKDGSGLGLPISKGIIQAHGGTLSVQSSRTDGTVFTITLPVSCDTAAAPSQVLPAVLPDEHCC